MRNKPKDVLHCGVTYSSVQEAHPKFRDGSLKLFHYYLTERLRIYIKKEVLKEERPWTNDYYLNEYKFTNVRRETDRTTRWLINNISNNKEIPYEDRLLATILFRSLSRIETCEMIKLNDPNVIKKLFYGSTKEVEEICSVIPDDFRICTNAFKTVGLKTSAIRLNRNIDNPLVRFVMLCRQFIPKIDDIKNCYAQDQVYDIITSVNGFGRFIAYQIFVDFTYIDEFQFSENEFVVSGPGCNYGLRFLFEDWDGLQDEELLFWMRDNLEDEFKKNNLQFNKDYLFQFLPEWDRNLNVMSLENCMCEFSKYYVCTHIEKKHKKMPRHYREIVE